jgi:UDP-N-acetylmuramyl tripeptide synthase
MQVSRDTAAMQAHAVFSGEVDIPDDGAASIQTPWAGGLFAFASIDSVYPQAAHSGLVSYDTGATLALVTLAAGPSVENAGAVALTGTTGTDGKTTLSAQAGALQIENRFGSDRRFRFTFLC